MDRLPELFVDGMRPASGTSSSSCVLFRDSRIVVNLESEQAAFLDCEKVFSEVEPRRKTQKVRVGSESMEEAALRSRSEVVMVIKTGENLGHQQMSS